jgi:hypothetical protein
MNTTMRMPGFTAEGSLCASKTQYKTAASHHRLTSAFLAQYNVVVPQLPIKFGQVCGNCIPGSFAEAHLGVGMRECCDFWCDPPKGSCWKSGCAKNPCSNHPFDNIFDTGGGVLDPGGGINTGGGVFDPGGGVFNTGGGVFSQ